MGSILHQHESAASKLRAMIVTSGPIILAPGVYDGFSARIALAEGFDAIYMVRKPTPRDLILKIESRTNISYDGIHELMKLIDRSGNQRFKTRTCRSRTRESE